jgi:hypothetical protein
MGGDRLLLSDLPERRTVRDASGTEWQVWEVHAMLEERRRSRERRQSRGPDRGRRTNAVDVAGLVRESLGGWLVFRSSGERRRLVPVPWHWETMSDEALVAALRDATHTRR